MKTILLVEDNDDDVFLMKNACLRTGIPHHLAFATDGDAALDYLAGNGEFADRGAHPFPDLVFLDIKLPRRSGHEVLEWIRTMPSMKSLPVVMLTTSENPEDVELAYKLGVTSYLCKMANIVEFGQAVRIYLKYWLVLNIPRS